MSNDSLKKDQAVGIICKTLKKDKRFVDVNFDTKQILRFFLHSVQLSSQMDQESFWTNEIVPAYEKLLDDEMESDGSRVMDLADVSNAVQDNKDFIFDIAKDVENILENIFSQIKDIDMEEYANKNGIDCLVRYFYQNHISFEEACA